VEYENLSFEYVNAHWLLNELPVASDRGPGGRLTQKKPISEVGVKYDVIHRMFNKQKF